MQFERVFRGRTHAALALLLAASALGAVGCKDSKSSTAPVVPYLVTVTPLSANLAVGGTQQLTATVKDFYNNTMSTPVTWESSIPTVATVSATGLVTMVKSGSTTIVARVAPGNGQAYGTAVVSAATPVASISTGIPATLAIPTTLQLAPTALDASGGQLLPGSGFTYSSSAPTIVSVSAKGLLTAVAPGSAVITVTGGGVTTTATIQAIVFTPVSSITFSPASAIVAVGGTQQLTPIVKDAAGNVLTGKPIVFATSSATVATVSQTGLVTVVGGGFANITATSEGKVGTFALTVPLVGGTIVTGVGGAINGYTTYLVNVPVGSTSLTVSLSGGTGDPDLFMYAPGVTPDVGSFERGTGNSCVSGNDVGVTESCTISGPTLTPGVWSIQIQGYATYAGWTLKATILP